MAVGDEVRDPWSWVVGGLSGGLAWALVGGAAGGPVGLAVGATVFGVKVLTGALTGKDPRTRRRDRRDRRLPVLTRTPEAAWFARARQATFVFEDIARTAREGPIADRVRTFGDETFESLHALERLAGQASAIRVAMSRLDRKRLVWERDRILKGAQGGQDPRVLAERQRALDALQSQLDAFGRLDGTLSMLLARLESGTLAIEGLVARLAEVVALAETSAAAEDGTTQVEELAAELEGLRAGLIEAESVSNRAMQGLPPLSAATPDNVTADEPGQSQVRRRAGE